MANIALIFRSAPGVNRFREALLAALAENNFDRALLCSGFFQEGVGAYSISDSIFLDPALNPRIANLHLTTVGVYSSAEYSRYADFISNLIGISAGIHPWLTITSLLSTKFHAKVFIAWVGDVPAFGIIGSSNATRRAADIGSPWNREADVIIWNDACPPAVALADALFPPLADGELADEDILFANYELGGQNGERPIEVYLNDLAAQIVAGANQI